MKQYALLKKKIKSKKAVITVMGLGYVGLPIALEFCRKGFKVNGLDTDSGRIEKLKKGISYINDIPASDISKEIKRKRLNITTDSAVVSDSDAIIICVPTPLRKIKDPDISYVVAASRTMSRFLRPGQLIILESTTYPGTTRDVILPELKKSGLERE